MRLFELYTTVVWLIHIVDLPANVEEEFKEDIFYTMSMEDRIKYCNEAKDLAELDVAAAITYTPLKYLPVFKEILVECRTIPIMYLCKWGGEKKISITMQENEFLEYSFEVQITKSEPILYSESTGAIRGTTFTEMSLADFIKEIKSTNVENYQYSNRIRVAENMTLADLLIKIGAATSYNKRVNDNRISRLKKGEPIQLCWAAKKHLRKLEKVPALQSDRIGPAEIFDFGNEMGDQVALFCHSAPSMYVYFKNPNASTTDLIQIVLVQNN